MVLGMAFVEENKKLASEIGCLTQEKGLDEHTVIEQGADLLDFIKHGVILAPAIIIDGKLKSAGRKPSKEEMIEWLDNLEEQIEETEERLAEMTEEEYINEISDDDLDL